MNQIKRKQYRKLIPGLRIRLTKCWSKYIISNIVNCRKNYFFIKTFFLYSDFKKDVKNDLKKKFLSHHFMYPRTENLTPYGAAPWYGFNEHFTHPYCSHKAKSERRSCGRFNFPFHGSDSHQMLGYE